jgi:hypothetical protein
VKVSYAWNTVAEECGKRVEVKDIGYEILQDISHGQWKGDAVAITVMEIRGTRHTKPGPPKP